MTFEHDEDRIRFCELLCRDGESLKKYSALFDFGSVSAKRRQFQKERPVLMEKLRAKHGPVCMLRYSRDCTGGSDGLTIDHLVPLSTNKLNKELRRVVPRHGRKVPTQSFGSNHLANLVLACAKCNGAKKHRLLSRDEFARLLKETSSMLAGASSQSNPRPEADCKQIMRSGRRRI